MRQKIIAINNVPSCGGLLIAMHRDEEGEDYILLSAWHRVDDNKYFYQFEQLRIDDENVSPERFIHDYSWEQAYFFVNKFYENEVKQELMKKAVS